MARSRSPDSIKAEELFHSGMSLAEIARKLGKPEGTVRRWKSTQKWEEDKSERSEIKANVRNDKKRNKKEAVADEVNRVMKNQRLTNKQQLFCLYYIRYFNATKAYQKAYECSYNVANAEGYKLLVNPCIKEEIRRMKQNRLNREMLDESDIFQKYMDIAFSDITDYVSFGTEEAPVMTMYGPAKVEDKENGGKKILTKTVNVVRFKESTIVDGTLISEVKQGKDGASIKLMDKHKALEWIADHMDMATEEQRARIEALRSKVKDDKETPINITFKKASESHGKGK
ncbi:MAG: terminase small subunit [Blautia obeum]|nr:terminase small subunit [Blautia obeum]